MVLSGAGLSTESGIPDYRGPSSKRRTRGPIRFQEFISSAHTRQRYWARSAIGWSQVGRAAANLGHIAIARLEELGYVNGVVTQNVDGLHHGAGSKEIIELHGALRRVVCLDCGGTESRDNLQERMIALNPGWLELGAQSLPDGDAELPSDVAERFTVPVCLRCAGVLKPDRLRVRRGARAGPRERLSHILAGAEGGGAHAPDRDGDDQENGEPPRPHSCYEPRASVHGRGTCWVRNHVVNL